MSVCVWVQCLFQYWHVFYFDFLCAFKQTHHTMIRAIKSKLAVLQWALQWVESVKMPSCPLLSQEHAPAAVWLVLLRFTAGFLCSYWSIWSSIIAEVPSWKSMKSEQDLQTQRRVKLERGRKYFPGNKESVPSKLNAKTKCCNRTASPDFESSLTNVWCQL